MWINSVRLTGENKGKQIKSFLFLRGALLSTLEYLTSIFFFDRFIEFKI